jgi:hypothetical protein
MSEESKPTGPIFRKGCRSRISPKTASCSGTPRASRCWLRVVAGRCSLSAPNARTITARSPRGCASATLSAAPGTTAVSACARARRYGRRRLVRSRAGGSSSAGGRSLCTTSSRRHGAQRGRQRADSRSRWLSSAAGQQASRSRDAAARRLYWTSDDAQRRERAAV